MIAAKPTSITRSGRLARRAAATLALAFVAMASATAEPRYSFDATPGRLPKTVVPTHYAIELEPNLDSLTLADSSSSTSRCASRPQRWCSMRSR